MGTVQFWINADHPTDEERVLWLGAGTKDTGLAFTRLTFKFTHATDADTNCERDYIIQELKLCGVIGDVAAYQTGDRRITEDVNHYVTDGRVALAQLGENLPAPPPP